MKQFNIEDYLKNPSVKVVTRDGKSVKIHCIDYTDNDLIIAKIEGDDHSHSFYKNGRFLGSNKSCHDLFFASGKHEAWLNIFGSDVTFHIDPHPYASKERAENEGKLRIGYIATGKLEWEE